MSQIALPLDTDSVREGNGYLVTEANAQVHEQLQNWQNWPNRIAILVGPVASGKSIMARSFQRNSHGSVIENAHEVSDDALFHEWNRAKEAGDALLLLSSVPVSMWQVALADLKSRLAASLLMEIGPPDEAMVEGLLQKYFTLRRLSISEDALRYLVKRMERSYNNVQNLARKMEMLAIEKKKPVTRAIAQVALEQCTDSSEED